MATESIEFSRARLNALPIPAKRTYYKDAATRALVIAVLPSGTKSFEIYRKAEGVPTRIGLGHFDPDLPESRVFPKGTDPLDLVGNAPKLNVAMARLMAAAVNAQLDVGINPALIKQATRKAKKEELTLQEAFDRYEQDYLIPHGKRTVDDIKSMFDRNIGFVAPGQKKTHGRERKKSPYGVDWSKRKLSEISADDVRGVHIKLKEGHGLHTANRVLELLRAIYNKMTEWKLYKGENPCIGVAEFKEASRERFLTGEEIPQFFAALEKNDSQDFKDFVLLCLLTGGRRENILGMRWGDFDFDAGNWQVRGEVSKNGSPLTLPLSQPAMELLVRRKQQANDGVEFVFPAKRKSKDGHMTAPKKQWAAFLKEVGIEDFRLHDLRRSLGSWLVMTGASLHMTGTALGHKSLEATLVYARLQNDSIKSALDVATTKILIKGGVISTPDSETSIGENMPESANE